MKGDFQEDRHSCLSHLLTKNAGKARIKSSNAVISSCRAIAMTPETVQNHLLRHPFEPFRVCLSDGSAYEVRQPEMVLVMQREVIIALPKPKEPFPRHLVYCDLLHITRIETIDGRKTKPRSKA